MKGPLLIPILWIAWPASAWAAEPATAGRGVETASGTDGSSISISAEIGTTAPYQNQPIEYIVRCVVRGNISDLSLSELSVGNAIVQAPDKPDIHDKVEAGIIVRVAEFHYIITPLQPGKLTIPPVVLQGKFEPPDLATAVNPFGEKLSSGVRQALEFFSAHGAEPFRIASGATQLRVKPPAAAMDPWLPLTSLKIIEDTDTPQSIRVGDPLTRKITLLADSAVGSQLPDLEEQQDHKNFKVYAGRTTMGQDIDDKNGAILGWRKESYDLIAQKAGRLVLPAIRVSWWDIVNRKSATAELEQRVVDVLPAAVARAPQVGSVRQTTAAVRASSPRTPSRRTASPNVGSSLSLYGFAAGLAAALLFAAAWRLRRKVDRPTAKDSSAIGVGKTQREKSTSIPAVERGLVRVRTAEELKNFLQAYAHERDGAPKNASLEKIFAALPKSQTEQRRADAEIVIEELAAALYADKTADVEELKERCRRIIASPKSERRSGRKREEMLPRLNPS